MMIPPTVIASETKQSPHRDLEIASTQPFDSAANPSTPLRFAQNAAPLRMRRAVTLASIAALAAVVLTTYRAALLLNFYGDDYSFLELAGRSSFAEYLAAYFDPRWQTGWFRPMQGMVFGIEWMLFGGNPVGYHLVNVLAHLANVLLLFALVGVISQKWRAAFLSALLYSGLPLYGVAVFWPGDADFLLTFFYLASMLLWVLHWQQGKRRFFVLSFVCFLLALMTKEFGVTLPIVLFLADRLLLQRHVIANEAKQSPPRDWEIASSHPSTPQQKNAAPLRTRRAMTLGLARRYVPFLIVYLLYLPLEYYIQSRSVLTNTYGYRVADHVALNFVQYLAWLAFPWSLPEPLNYVWLGAAILLYGFILLRKKSAPLLFLGIAAILAFLPVTPFPWFFTRYLYLAVTATAIVIAFLIDGTIRRFARARWFAPVASAALALIVLGNSVGVAGAVADFAELGRQTRVPFRDISQRHATFPDDTYLYFINPPTITSQLSGMFFLRYGAGVHVASDADGNRRADLRAHANAYVIYFDEERRTREAPVDKASSIETRPALPVDFVAPIRLEGFELANANVKRAQPIVLLLYWRALKPVENDYAVVAQLVDGDGKVVASYENEPRHGAAHTSQWQTGQQIVDAIVLPVAAVMPGKYRLEFGLVDSTTRQRLNLLDPSQTRAGDRIVIEPLRILE